MSLYSGDLSFPVGFQPLPTPANLDLMLAPVCGSGQHGDATGSSDATGIQESDRQCSQCWRPREEADFPPTRASPSKRCAVLLFNCSGVRGDWGESMEGRITLNRWANGIEGMTLKTGIASKGRTAPPIT